MQDSALAQLVPIGSGMSQAHTRSLSPAWGGVQEKAKASDAAAAKAQAAAKEPAQPTPALDSRAKPSDAAFTLAPNGQVWVPPDQRDVGHQQDSPLHRPATHRGRLPS